MDKKQVKYIESKIGYTFNHKSILQQAFTTKSYSNKYNCANSEVLEFIGDKILDFYVVELFAQKYGRVIRCVEGNNEYVEYSTKYDPGEFTQIKSLLVRRKHLAWRTEMLGFDKFIKYFPNNNLTEKRFTAYKEDLFEAILGAIAIDSNYDYKILKQSVRFMLDANSTLAKIENDALNPIKYIENWSIRNYKETPNYIFEYNQKKNYYICKLSIANHTSSFLGEGVSQEDAKREAADKLFGEILRSDSSYDYDGHIEKQ